MCIPCRPHRSLLQTALWCCLQVSGLADAHMEGTGSRDSHVTVPGRQQQVQCQRVGEAVDCISEVHEDTTEQCSNGHCEAIHLPQSHVHDMGRSRSHTPSSGVSQCQIPDAKFQCDPVHNAEDLLMVDLCDPATRGVKSLRSYASALMSAPLQQRGRQEGADTVTTTSSSSTSTSSRGCTPVLLDTSGQGDDTLLDVGDQSEYEEQSKDTKLEMVSEPEEQRGEQEVKGEEGNVVGQQGTSGGISVGSRREDQSFDDGMTLAATNLSQEVLLSHPDVPSTPPPLSMPSRSALGNFSPSHSPIRVHPPTPLTPVTPKLVSVSSPQLGLDEDYAGSPLLRSTSALGVAADALPSYFSSTSPPNSLPDVSSPLIKVRLSSLTRTSSAPCPLPQVAPASGGEERDIQNVTTANPSANQMHRSGFTETESESAQQMQEGEEDDRDLDDRSDSSISKSSGLSITANEFVPKFSPSNTINHYPLVQPQPVAATLGSSHQPAWFKSTFPPSVHHQPPPHHHHHVHQQQQQQQQQQQHQQSILNQPSFPVQLLAQLQLQHQIASVTADQRITSSRIFNQPLHIPVPLSTLQHSHPAAPAHAPPQPAQPAAQPPTVVHPTLPVGLQPFPQPVQTLANMAIRQPTLPMTNKPSYPSPSVHPSVLQQYFEKQRDNKTSQMILQQQLHQQQQRQKGLKVVSVPSAQPSTPVQHRHHLPSHPQQLSLLPTAPPPTVLPQQLPLQTQSQLASSSLLLNRQHQLAQISLSQGLAVLSPTHQTNATTPAEIIRRQPSNRPPLLPTPPDFTFITARTATMPGAPPTAVTSAITPPVTWPPQSRLPAPHDPTLASLPLNPPISLPNQQ